MSRAGGLITVGSELANGFQPYVDTTTNTIVATASAGTPAAGYFYSSIVGRASMPDLKPLANLRLRPVQPITSPVVSARLEV